MVLRIENTATYGWKSEKRKCGAVQRADLCAEEEARNIVIYKMGRGSWSEECRNKMYKSRNRGGGTSVREYVWKNLTVWRKSDTFSGRGRVLVGYRELAQVLQEWERGVQWAGNPLRLTMGGNC